MQIKALPVGAMGTNCYLLEDESTNAAAVVDPGGDAGRILAQLRADGMTVRAILLTHAHFDHTGAVSELRQALPGVPVYLHPADAALLGSDIFPPIGATVPYDEGDALTVGLPDGARAAHPGHTPGGVTLLAGDALFTGDTLLPGLHGRTDFAGGSYEAILASLRRLGQLSGDYQVLPGHMDASTLERERRSNYYLMEALEG